MRLRACRPDFRPQSDVAPCHHRCDPNDPGWRNGEYTQPPAALKVAAEIQFFMGSNPRCATARHRRSRARSDLDEYASHYVATETRTTSCTHSRRRAITTPTGARKDRGALDRDHTADDLINPRSSAFSSARSSVSQAACVVPLSEETVGRLTHESRAVEAVSRRILKAPQR